MGEYVSIIRYRLLALRAIVNMTLSQLNGIDVLKRRKKKKNSHQWYENQCHPNENDVDYDDDDYIDDNNDHDDDDEDNDTRLVEVKVLAAFRSNETSSTQIKAATMIEP